MCCGRHKTVQGAGDQRDDEVCVLVGVTAQPESMTCRAACSEHNQRPSLSASPGCEPAVARSFPSGEIKVGLLSPSRRCGPQKSPPRAPSAGGAAPWGSENTRSSRFCPSPRGSLISGRLRAPSSLHHPRLPQSSDFSQF